MGYLSLNWAVCKAAVGCLKVAVYLVWMGLFTRPYHTGLIYFTPNQKAMFERWSVTVFTGSTIFPARGQYLPPLSCPLAWSQGHSANPVQDLDVNGACGQPLRLRQK